MRVLAIVLLIALYLPAQAWADGNDPVIEEIRAQTARLTAEKELIAAREALVNAQRQLEELEMAPDEETTEAQRLAAEGELFDARKTLATKELAYLAEMEKLEEARNPAPEEEAAEASLKEAARIKAQAEADKAAAEAQKALAEAEAANVALENARVKALFGDVPDGGIDGSVTAGANSGVAEAALLATKGLRELAQRIAEDVGESVGDNGVWLVCDANIPGPGAMISFELQSSKLLRDSRGALSAADLVASDARDLSPFDETGEEISRESVAGIVTGVGAGLDVLSKIGKYFQSQYTVAGVDGPDFGNGPLMDAVAGSLAAVGITVYTPSRFHPAFSWPIDIENNEVFQRLFKLTELLDSLVDRRAVLARHLQADAVEQVRRESALNAANSELAAIGDGDTNAADRRLALQATITNIKQSASEWAQVKGRADLAMAKLEAAMTATAEYVDGLTTKAAEQSRAPIVDLVLENHMLKALRSGEMLLIVNLTSVKGSYYTRKNLWTFFGSMPFYHMAGAVVNYSLLSGSTGAVLHAGALTHHSGFMKSHQVRGVVNE